GVVFTYFYTRFGKNASRGDNLVIEQGNGGEGGIPLRLIPLTLFGTFTTHLFGGSVGSKGTAEQMRGAIANAVGEVLSLSA
ncbi:chloride channel protein, partial [Enterococcus faecalis]|uniref:chloride channel protein n=1 Tax=Enterococcus faecalis TaxID=1351 RepID=UPI003D6AEA61